MNDMIAIDPLYISDYSSVKKFKSVRRAIRHNNVNSFGTILPKRPFNNRKNKPLENKKRLIYFNIKELKKVM